MLFFYNLGKTIKFFIINIKMFFQLVDPLDLSGLADLLYIIFVLFVSFLKLLQLRF